jgi:hypothetical protein
MVGPRARDRVHDIQQECRWLSSGVIRCCADRLDLVHAGCVDHSVTCIVALPAYAKAAPDHHLHGRLNAPPLSPLPSSTLPLPLNPLTRSRAATFAPPPSRCSTTARWPLWAARMSAVSFICAPSRSGQWREVSRACAVRGW